MTFTGRGLRARGARWTARAAAAALLVLAAAAAAQPEALERRLCDADLAPDELRPQDLFGCALDASGDELVVGSVHDDGRGTDAGAVYVFAARRGGFRETAYLSAAAVAPGDLLGFAVAVDGDRLVAGAPFHDGAGGSGGRDAGGAWVFRRGAAGWEEEAELAVGGFAGGLGRVDLLGYAVAIDGARVALGAPGDDDRGDAAGAVYLFEPAADGAWNPVAKLTDAAGAVGDGFGSSLALDGDTLLVGAPYRARGAGAVVVFRRGADGTWRQAETLAGDGAASALFGHSVDLDGAWAVVGARGDDRDGRERRRRLGGPPRRRCLRRRAAPRPAGGGAGGRQRARHRGGGGRRPPAGRQPLRRRGGAQRRRRVPLPVRRRRLAGDGEAARRPAGGRRRARLRGVGGRRPAVRRRLPHRRPRHRRRQRLRGQRRGRAARPAAASSRPRRFPRRRR